MFVDTNQILEIIVHFKRQGHLFAAYSEKDFKKLKLTTEKAEEFQTLKVQMKLLTWGMNNELNESAMTEDNEGNRKFNYKLFKENKLAKLIASWDAKDAEEKAVPINSQMLAKLSPSIAETLLNAYDELSSMTEEQEGN